MVGYTSRKKGYKSRTVTLKIRFKNFTTLNKSTTLENPTNIDEIIFKEIIKLLEKINIRKGGVRLLGVKLSKLTSNHAMKQLSLLGEKEDKLEQLTQSLDKIREKYGKKAVNRASLLSKE